MQQRRTLRLTLGFLSTAAVLLLSSASSAWVHPINETISYYIPGPPPGPELGICRVETKLWWDGAGAYASIKPLRDAGCKPGSGGAWVQVVAAEPGVALLNGPLSHSTDDWPGLSAYPESKPVFGAHFAAINVFGYTHTWSVAFIE